MSHNHLPAWGQPTPEQPKPKPGRGKKIAIGVGAAFVVLIVIAVATGGGSDDKKTVSAEPAPTVTVTVTATQKDTHAAKAQPTVTVTKTITASPTATHKPKPKKTTSADEVTFKVWGDAPAGADITYGSDSDNRQGSSHLPMTKTIKFSDDAMYYDLTAQLQGGGDIHCSVTVQNQTKTAHASGGYNICDAQLSSDFLGGWE